MPSSATQSRTPIRRINVQRRHAQHLAGLGGGGRIEDIDQHRMQEGVRFALCMGGEIQGELVPVRQAADRIAAARQGTQLQFVHRSAGQGLQLAPLGFGKLPGRIVHDAERTDGHAVARNQWRACIEAKLRWTGHQRIAGVAWVRAQIIDDQRMGRTNRRGAD